MADKWDKYLVSDESGAVEASDPWAKYEVKPVSKTNPSMGEITRNFGNAAKRALTKTQPELAFGAPMDFTQSLKREAFGLKPDPAGLINGDMKGVGDYFIDSLTDPRNYAMASIPNVKVPKAIARSFTDKAKIPFYDKLESEVNNFRWKKIVGEFGEKVNEQSTKYPDAKASINDIGLKLQTLLPHQPELAPFIRKVPKLREIVEKPDRGAALSARETTDIINSLKNQLPESMRKGNSFHPSYRPVVGLIQELQGKLSESFPELENIRNDYRKDIGRYNLVKNKFKGDALENSLNSKFGGARSREALKRILSPESLNDIRSVQAVNKIKNLGGFIGKKALEGSALGGAAKMTFDLFD